MRTGTAGEGAWCAAMRPSRIGSHRDEHLSMTHLVQHAVQLITRLANAIAIIGVDHKDQALCVLEVVAPERADLRRGTCRKECWSARGNGPATY